MSAHDQFLQAIVDDPENDLPRLVYADWLDEQGDPRGEYIRVQCELAPLDQFDPGRKPLEDRQDTLFKKHKSKWTKVLKVAAIRSYEFRRGFVEIVTLNAKNHLQNAEALLDRVPTIREMKINAMKTVLNELLESKWLERLEALNFTSCQMGTRRLKRLLRSKHLKNIRKLDLTSNGLGTAGFHAMMHADTLPNLKTLLLNNMNLPAVEGLEKVGQGRLWSQLTEVELSSNELNDIHLIELVENWPKCDWKRINLSYNPISESGLNAFLEGGHANSLETLELRGARHLSDTAMETLANADGLQNLRSLDLCSGSTDVPGLRAIMNSEKLKNLRRMTITCDGSASDAFRTVAEAKGLPALEELNLQTRPLNMIGVEPLRQPGKFHSLKTLVLTFYMGDPKVTQELRRLLPDVNIV